MRSHGNGHNSNALEGLEFANATALATLAHQLIAENSGGPIAAAAPVVWDSGAFVTRRGKVKVTAHMTATGTGGTAIAGANVKFAMRMDGAAVATTPISDVELSPTKVEADGSLTWIFSGLTPESSHTFGIQATDLTAGGTLVVPQYAASLVIEDLI